MNSFSPMPSSNPKLFDTKMRSAAVTCSRIFNSPLAGTFLLCSSYYPVFMTFTAVSLMTTTATLHQSFKKYPPHLLLFSFFNLIPFSTLIIESSHVHKQ